MSIKSNDPAIDAERQLFNAQYIAEFGDPAAVGVSIDFAWISSAGVMWRKARASHNTELIEGVVPVKTSATTPDLLVQSVSATNIEKFNVLLGKWLSFRDFYLSDENEVVKHSWNNLIGFIHELSGRPHPELAQSTPDDTDIACSSCGLTMSESKLLHRWKHHANDPGRALLETLTYTVNGEVMSPLEYISHLHDEINTLRSKDKGNVEWGRDVEKRLISTSKEQESDVANLMAEAACALAALTLGAPSSTKQENATDIGVNK